ncbi:MAG: ArsR/SmtB family transcription factor [Chloroflexota bacterium]
MVGRVAQRQREMETGVDTGLLTALTALADPVRLRIVRMLCEREQCVCHLTEALGLSQGTVSHHMGLLKRAGLVNDRRDPDDSRWTYYSLDEASVSRFLASIRVSLDTSHMDPTPASCRGRPEHRSVD